MDAQIEYLTGESFRLEDIGVNVKDFLVSSIAIESEYQSIEGAHGRRSSNATYSVRTIRVPFYFESYDLHDFPLLRDEIFAKLTKLEGYYIRELRRMKPLTYAFVDTNKAPKMKEGTENRLVGGKRYLVRIANQYEIEQMLLIGEGELVFETIALPFAESVGTTADIDKNGLRYSDELWSYGMGLSYDETTHKYTHDGKTFRVYNAGNERITPFNNQDLKIVISNIQGSTSYFQLRNKANETRLRITESVGADKTVTVDKTKVLIGSAKSLRKTTKEFIELEPGWNEFEITGATSAKVKFDFRYYYK